jgi:hypothetical protein
MFIKVCGFFFVYWGTIDMQVCHGNSFFSLPPSFLSPAIISLPLPPLASCPPQPMAHKNGHLLKLAKVIPLLKVVSVGGGNPPNANNKWVSHPFEKLLGHVLSWPTLDEEQAARMQATIDRQKKELAKQCQKLTKYRDKDGKSSLLIWDLVVITVQ